MFASATDNKLWILSMCEVFGEVQVDDPRALKYPNVYAPRTLATPARNLLKQYAFVIKNLLKE